METIDINTFEIAISCGFVLAALGGKFDPMGNGQHRDTLHHYHPRYLVCCLEFSNPAVG